MTAEARQRASSGGDGARLWRWVLAAVVVGVALRVFFILYAGRVAGDTLLYGDIADNLLKHGVYGFTDWSGARPTLIRVPGYPFFLAACFKVFGLDHYRPVMYLQVLVDLATCGLVSGLSGRLFGRRGGLAALWLAVLCPFTAMYVATPLTETLSLFCIAAVFYGMERWRSAGLGFGRWLWVITAALAAAVVLRPEQGLLAAAVIPAMLWMCLRLYGRGRGWLRACAPVVVATVCMLLPLGGWAVRNWRTFHVIQPLAPKEATDPGELMPLGFQRWYRTWGVDFASTEEVYWNYDSDAIAVGDLPARAFDSPAQYEETAALLKEYDQTTRATAAFEARFAALAQERVKAHPVRYYVELPVARLVNMVFRPRLEMLEISLEWWKWSEHPAETAFAVFWGAVNLLYLVVGVVGFARWRERGGLGWAMFAYLALRCALLLTIDNSEPRYTLEFFPVLFVFGARIWKRVLPDGPAARGAITL